MLHYYSNKNDFLLSNTLKNNNFSENLTKKDSSTHIFGYCINRDKIYKNEDIYDVSFDQILQSNIESSGVFAVVKFSGNSLDLILDPLCQFNVFYYYDESDFALSSSITALKEYLGLNEICSNYLYDQIAYQSPMRGLTILENVFSIQFDDLENNSNSRSGFLKINSIDNIKIHRPNYNFYDQLSYNELLDLYIDRLNSRANLVAKSFDHIHIQLTGGADSRLAFSSFSKLNNVECYVYGNGESQNRLIFEEIIKARDIRSVSSIRFVGQPLNSIARILKALRDSNFLKLNNLNTYMNGRIECDDSYCKITGYYGANISGGVVLPPSKTSKNLRLNKIHENVFTYHDYVNDFSSKYQHLRPAAFNDRFYINNRGKSHYAAHSIADNKHVNSIDILYDYINLLLVEKCPYNDSDIDKNAITIDLISKNDRQLALFPYDSRTIPKYRHFTEVPIINCFSGFNFPHKILDDFHVLRPSVDTSEFHMFPNGQDYMSNKEIIKTQDVMGLASEYKDLFYLTEHDDIQTNIFLYFLLGSILLRGNS